MEEIWAKSETVDPEVRAYIYSLVNAVGGQSTLDAQYALGDDALAVLNDLLRWLRLYDEKTNRFDVKRCLAEAALVKNDLLEILALWPEEQQDNRLKSKLALACLQLLVPLTWPIELEEDKTTRNHVRHTPYLKLAQVGYKREILGYEYAQILRTAVRIGLPSMAAERGDRSKRDEGIIKLVLYFFRNIVQITQPQDLPSQGDENDISRSATIEAFHQQDVFSLLLTVGSGANDEFQGQDQVVLDTLFHLLKGIDPKTLFKQSEELATEETTELQNLIRKEKAMLNSYNKHAPTRHNRFGTMLWVKRDDSKMSTVTGQNTITDESTMMVQMDQSKKWNKPKYRGKMALEFNESSDFGMRIPLSEKARQHLRTFAEDFLDSSFNPLFASLRKTIERDTELSQHTTKQYFYLISWFLDAEASRRDAVRSASGWNADRPSSTQVGDNTYAYIASVLDQETFVLLNRHMQKSYDEKSWQDLQANLLCFTQILLTVQSMADSKDEEDQEIAENIQNRIFYEESTQERIVQVLRGYTNQGLAYLDAVTECVHVFVRMLERYSKTNVDLQIRSKVRARKKARKDAVQEGRSASEEPESNDLQQEDYAEAITAVRERKFDFTRFSAKFLTQPCVNTFIALLHFYQELSPSQMKRCHRYFYRLAFKNELAILLFRVDILALLQKMIKGPDGLDSSAEGFKEWEQLIQQIFRRCVKWIERGQEGEGWREAAVVEMLFSKVPGTLFYLQNGFERIVEKRTPRPPADMEVKASVELGKRIEVVVCVMLEKGMQDAIEWVKKELKRAAEERKAWEDEHHARDSLAPDDDENTDKRAQPPPPTIFMSPDSEDRKTALFKNKFLRLLLTVAGLQRLGTAEDVDASWILPSDLGSSQLEQLIKQIQATEHSPPEFEDGKTAQDLIRNKSSSARRGATGSDDESGSDRDIDENQFPANLREKRRRDGDEVDEEDNPTKKKRRLARRERTELTEEQAKAKAEERRRKERERNSKIKSQLFVTASDDESDEEADAQFFQLEEERRKKMRGIIRGQLMKEKKDGTKKKRGGKKRRLEDLPVEASQASQAEVGSELDDDPDSPKEDIGRERHQIIPVDDSSNVWSDDDPASEHDAPGTGLLGERSDNIETPSTSQTALEGEPNMLPLNEVSGNLAGPTIHNAKSRVADDLVSEDEEYEMPISKPAARRNIRADFIIDSDSE